MSHAIDSAANDPVGERALEMARYRDNWVGHLLGIARDLGRRVIDRLEQECGYAKIRPSLGPFLSLVWRAARPLTDLAEQLAISRQACSKLARHAEASGYVERVDGPDGDRAQRVRLTGLGRRLVEDSIRLVLEAEASYADWIGEERLRRLNAASSTLFFGLGLEHKTDAGLGEAAGRSIGVLPLIVDRLEEELREATRAKGHDELQISHARLIALVGDGAKSVSEIARLQGVSRQATGATVSRLEELGYVWRDCHRSDARAVQVRLAARGEELVRDTLGALAELEERFREILGPRAFADLVAVAAELHGVLTFERDLSSARVAASPSALPAPPGPPARPDLELRAIAALLEQRLGEHAANRLGRMLSRKRTVRRA